MSDNEIWDREEVIRRFFDPENVDNLLQYSPESFLAIIMNEIRQENDIITLWSRTLHEDPSLGNQTLVDQYAGKNVAFFTESIMRASRIITRILDTAGAYREKQRKRTDTQS
ncbi:MAG: hypothetical protein JNJ61_28980 [Anaerolineae bacterium]|nr:hypothetical protein [Anaerolineae bacterium]